MKTQIKFGIIDIILCILLIFMVALNIWLYIPKSNKLSNITPSYISKTPTISSENNEISYEYLSELSLEILEGLWNVTMIMYSDNDLQIPYAYYDLKFDIQNQSEDLYSINVTTMNSWYEDASINPDVPPVGFAPSLIEDETYAQIGENGSLKFWFSFEDDIIYNVFFKYDENNVIKGISYLTHETGLPEGGMCTYLELEKYQ